jgi:hypothetical protein
MAGPLEREGDCGRQSPLENGSFLIDTQKK